MAYNDMVTVDISMRIPQIDKSVFDELVIHLSEEGFNVRGAWIDSIGYLHMIHPVEDVETRMVSNVVYNDTQAVEMVLEDIVQFRKGREIRRRV